MADWKMMKEFGRAIGKRTGAPNKTSKMIERVAGDSDEFLEGKRHGQSLMKKATSDSFQAMYDRLDDEAKAVYNSYDWNYERMYGPDAAYRQALEDAKIGFNTEVPTDKQGWLKKYGFDIGDPAPRNVDVSKRVDKLSADESEKALNTEFDKAFDEAAENHGYKKWREESKDMPLDDGFKGDLHDVNREDAVQRSREEIIKALQQNTDRDVTDVLRDFGYIIEE
jgi:hypothetical protein